MLFSVRNSQTNGGNLVKVNIYGSHTGLPGGRNPATPWERFVPDPAWERMPVYDPAESSSTIPLIDYRNGLVWAALQALDGLDSFNMEAHVSLGLLEAKGTLQAASRICVEIWMPKVQALIGDPGNLWGCAWRNEMNYPAIPVSVLLGHLSDEEHDRLEKLKTGVDEKVAFMTEAFKSRIKSALDTRRAQMDALSFEIKCLSMAINIMRL